MQYDAQADVLTKTMKELHDVDSSLKLTKMCVKQVEDDTIKQKRIIQEYIETKQILCTEIEFRLNVIKEASGDARKLHDKLDCKK